MVTTEIKTIKPAGGGDYNSLNDWELAERTNLVTADKIKVAEIYGGGSCLTPPQFVMASANWTVDANRYVIIRAASGQAHSGVLNTSKAWMSVGLSGVAALHISVGFTRIGPGISMSGSHGCMQFDGMSGNTPVLVEGMIVVPFYEAGIYFISCGTGNHVVKNCALYGPCQYYFVRATSSICTVYNCTIVNTLNYAGCLWANGASSIVVSQNNYLSTAMTNAAYLASGGGTMTKGDHDATYDGEALTPSLQNIPYTNANFLAVTGGSENLHLQPTSTLRMKGTTLADVTNDFEGDNRVGLVFDIGADQESDVPMCWNYTAQYKNSSKLYKASGCGSFPKSLRVPNNVNTDTGKMIDDGMPIDPKRYSIG